MGEIFYWIPRSIGFVLNFINNNVVFGNYGLAIIILTILIRLIILPLTLKQLKSTAQMQRIQPKIQALQEKYKNDKEKLYVEQQKLYKDEGVNMFGGCLPLLVQLPILFSLFYAISQPLKYQFGLGQDVVTKILAAGKYTGAYSELQFIIHNPNGIPQQIMNTLTPAFQEKARYLSDAVGGFNMNMNFLGINLGVTPQFSVAWLTNVSNWPLIALILISTALTWYSLKVSMAGNKNNPQAQQAAQMNGAMEKIMPIMTLYFAFVVPAALALYWAVGYVVQIIQQLVINKTIHEKNNQSENVISSTSTEVKPDIEKKAPTKQYRREQNKKNAKNKSGENS